MTYLERLSGGEKIKCREDNQDDIMKAITKISELFQTTVYILVEGGIEWIATKKSAFNYGDKVIELIEDEKGDWNPPGYKGSCLDKQLARLGHDSLNSQ